MVSEAWKLARQRSLEDQDRQVIRLPNEDVLEDVEAVMISIAKQLNLEVRFGIRKTAISGMKSENSPHSRRLNADKYGE